MKIIENKTRFDINNIKVLYQRYKIVPNKLFTDIQNDIICINQDSTFILSYSALII